MFGKGHKDGGMQCTWCTRTAMRIQSPPACGSDLFGINNFQGAAAYRLATSCEFAANSKHPPVALRDVRRELERPVPSGIQTTPPCRTGPVRSSINISISPICSPASQ
jgi:hypothetical protein